ncbi:MAG: DUF116 domain-containing protein [Selenomonas sp.]|uniref:DUF116 domain-containing protein n=1 Tax=uncultured Selenomonas sp. TaxID=159275 RepID=UPI0025CFFB3A|nr:DUF116 domain-containing protein [uncultured Selenomonas sp.]MDD6696882.1 DUF116 domain-containing protein [Veillonellaceae bacterium]MDY6349466.1 DUF116 domain-containing protein [Selenomonas sp.]
MESTQNIKKNFIMPKRPKKRVFLGMLSLTTLLMAVVLFVIWYIGVPGLAEIQPWLPTLLGAAFSAVVLLAFFGIVNMVLAVSGLPYLGILQKQTYELINALFPFAVYLGRLFGIRRRKLEASFIAVSNLLFRRRKIRVPASRLLVVTPHCLQLASCPHKITRDPHNCKRCGGCDIGALVTLADEMGFHFFVATGGTLARQIVRDTRPKAVLAIACERDLMSGIQDVYPLPAIGVLNIRPNGPCYNTHVDMELVRKQLEEIIIPEPKKEKEEKEAEQDGKR